MGEYRYGFNGKESDNEVKGEGNQQDYGLRIYDPRLGKFLSVDPLSQHFPWYTPYQFAGNKPIWCIDLDGAEELAVPLFSTTNTPILGGLNEITTELGSVAETGSIGKSSVGLEGWLARLGIKTPAETIADVPKGGAWDAFVNLYRAARNATILKPSNQSNVEVSQQKPATVPEPQANPGAQFDPKKIPIREVDNLEDFTKEEEGYEYFYRAMSNGEFEKTGGMIQQRDGKHSIPFITNDLLYLRYRDALIWRKGQSSKYDVIIKYTVPQGTRNYLEAMSKYGITYEQAVRDLTVIKKNEGYTLLGPLGRPLPAPNRNFGFAGPNGDVHYNWRILKMEKISTKTQGLHLP